MKKDKKKNLIQSALANLDKVQVLPGGSYEPYEIKAKYGQGLPRLPEHYTLIISSHFPFENKKKRS